MGKRGMNYFDDGALCAYFGPVKNSKPDGFGISILQTNVVLVGHFVQGSFTRGQKLTLYTKTEYEFTEGIFLEGKLTAGSRLMVTDGMETFQDKVVSSNGYFLHQTMPDTCSTTFYHTGYFKQILSKNSVRIIAAGQTIYHK